MKTIVQEHTFMQSFSVALSQLPADHIEICGTINKKRCSFHIGKLLYKVKPETLLVGGFSRDASKICVEITFRPGGWNKFFIFPRKFFGITFAKTKKIEVYKKSDFDFLKFEIQND